MNNQLTFRPCAQGLVAQLPNGGCIINYNQVHFAYELGDNKYVHYLKTGEKVNAGSTLADLLKK